MPDIGALRYEAQLWNRLRHEQDGRRMEDLEDIDCDGLGKLIDHFKNSEVPDPAEPNDFESIKRLLTADGDKKTPDRLRSRLEGALLGRFAGCVLGVPVENFSIDRMIEIAKRTGTSFPPTEYWRGVDDPDIIHYGVNRRADYTRGNLNAVPVDDDITYTVFEMLLLKKYGGNYTVNDAGEFWSELIPCACTAEDCALKRLNEGADAEHAACDNPFVEWIGGAIRGDSFGYVSAGDPMKAITLAYPEMYLTHRRNGIYGGLFTAAAVACAFTEKTPFDAVRRGATFIPPGSRLAKDLEWAFSYEGKLTDYLHARRLIDERFGEMDHVHTNNNMCAVVFAVMLGDGDFTRSVAESIAMGLDNDCNGATVGSIVGANIGIENIEEHWYAPFGDTVRTYLNGYETLSIGGMIDDYMALYEKLRES